MKLIAGRLERQYPESNSGWGAAVTPMSEQVVREARPVFTRASQDLFLQHLSPRERHALESAMRKIIGANRGHLPKPERADDRAQASPKR